VIARRQLRHDAAIHAVQIDLAIDLVREQAGHVVIDGDRGLIAGGFEGQDAHVYRVRTVAHAGLCFSL
jgi:hypothetical protein